MTLESGSTLAHSEIVGLLGKGGMGEVYRARDTRLKRDVAFKILPADVAANPEWLQRFQREAETVARMNLRTSSLSFRSKRTTAYTSSPWSWSKAQAWTDWSATGLSPCRK